MNDSVATQISRWMRKKMWAPKCAKKKFLLPLFECKQSIGCSRCILLSTAQHKHIHARVWRFSVKIAFIKRTKPIEYKRTPTVYKHARMLVLDSFYFFECVLSLLSTKYNTRSKETQRLEEEGQQKEKSCNLLTNAMQIIDFHT